jgi:shikimate kinase
LRDLLATREPIYAQADLTVQSRDVPHDTVVAEIVERLAAFLEATPPERRQS